MFDFKGVICGKQIEFLAPNLRGSRKNTLFQSELNLLYIY